MYAAIKKHPKVSRLYEQRLVEEGVIDADWGANTRKAFSDHLEGEFKAAADYEPQKADWFGGRWQGLHAPADPETARRNADTAIDKSCLIVLAGP